MPKEPAHIRALREYAKDGRAGLEELSAHDAELWGESDRAFAVLHAANLENALRDLFAVKFRPGLNSAERNALYGPDGSMSSFAAKIGLAYALEYIGRITRDDMDLVRLVRNSFAHSARALGFKMAVVADVCAHLQFPDLPNGYQLMGPLGRIASAEEADLSNPRNRYRVTCQRIAYGLLLLQVKPSPLMATIPPEPLL
jgi:hypothetical protein